MQDNKQPSNHDEWDPIVRAVHWSLALFFTLAYWSGGDWLSFHAHVGYCLALVVLVRIIWGFFGPDWARFGEFFVSVSGLVEYIKGLPNNRNAWSAGHDPAGGWMIIALLLMLSVTAISGTVLFALEDRGPLAGTMLARLPGAQIEAVHHVASEATLILVFLHILGVGLMSWYTRKNLIMPMVGKRQPEDE